MAKRSVLLGVMLTSGALVGGCGPSSPSAPPNVILISLDTLRRDHVGAYLEPGSSPTPALDDFARESLVFDRAYAQIAFTLPSHLSMFTGLQPDVHGVEKETASLGNTVRTLPEVLREAGYRTYGLVTNIWMKSEFGFGRGFDRYELLDYGLTYVDRVNRRSFELLDATADDSRPFFLFLHYIDAHSDFYNVAHNALPYYAPPEYLEKLGVDESSRRFCTADEECATAFLLACNQDPELVDHGGLEVIRQLYRVGVEYLDHELGRLFDGLRQRGLWDQTMIIVTADHGEEFLEHGEFIHNQPYVENLAVPLIIKFPHQQWAGDRRAAIVESVDLLPTLLDLLQIDGPSPLQGVSLRPVIEGDRAVKEHAFGRDKLNRGRYVVRSSDFSLILDIETGVLELFDLAADPGELTDVSSSREPEVAKLRRALQQELKAYARLSGELARADRIDGGLLTEEERDKLRSIGYVD